MATGRLAAQDLTAATLTTAYTTPASTYAVISVSICNRGTSTSLISLALADADTPTAGEYIEFETSLLAKNILERTGIVLGAGQKLVVRSSEANVNIVAVGIETPA